MKIIDLYEYSGLSKVMKTLPDGDGLMRFVHQVQVWPHDIHIVSTLNKLPNKLNNQGSFDNWLLIVGDKTIALTNGSETIGKIDGKYNVISRMDDCKYKKIYDNRTSSLEDEYKVTIKQIKSIVGNIVKIYVLSNTLRVSNYYANNILSNSKTRIRQKYDTPNKTKRDLLRNLYNRLEQLLEKFILPGVINTITSDLRKFKDRTDMSAKLINIRHNLATILKYIKEHGYPASAHERSFDHILIYSLLIAGMNYYQVEDGESKTDKIIIPMINDIKNGDMKKYHEVIMIFKNTLLHGGAVGSMSLEL